MVVNNPSLTPPVHCPRLRKTTHTCVPMPVETVLLMEQIDQGIVTADMIKTWTCRDPVLSCVQQFVQSRWPIRASDDQLHLFWMKRTELTIQDGCLLWGNQVVIPAAGRAMVLQELHEAHRGSTQMKRIAHTLVWWPKIDQDIEQEIKSCCECQANQSSPPASPLQPWS